MSTRLRGDTVLRVRRSNSEDGAAISATAKKLADIYRSGDEMVGAAKRSIIPVSSGSPARAARSSPQRVWRYNDTL